MGGNIVSVGVPFKVISCPDKGKKKCLIALVGRRGAWQYAKMLRGVLWFGLIMVCGVLRAADALPDGDAATLKLTRGDEKVYFFTPKEPAKSVVILGSGDGGWTYWEKRVCARLAAGGSITLGWNCKAYAKEKYTQDILAKDIILMINAAQKKSGSRNLPVILGGYSTGAEQSVAAAGGTNVKALLRGLLLVAPGDRGRYGLTLSDLMMMTPQGPDTFALSDFIPILDGLRTVQIHGGHDPLDSTKWLDKLNSPKRVMEYPGGWHSFNGADDAFLKMIDESVRWLLSDEPAPTKQKS